MEALFDLIQLIMQLCGLAIAGALPLIVHQQSEALLIELVGLVEDELFKDVSDG